MNSYSTLPRNGHIQQKTVKKNEQEYRFIQGCRSDWLLSKSASLNSRSAWKVFNRIDCTDCRISECWCRLSETYLQCLTWSNWLSITRSFGAEETEISLPEDTWSSHLWHYRLWIFSWGRFSLKWRTPKRTDTARLYALRCWDELDFVTKGRHLDCHCRQIESSRSWLVETYTPTVKAIELPFPHRRRLCIQLQWLRSACTPRVSNSKRLLHCRI